MRDSIQEKYSNVKKGDRRSYFGTIDLPVFLRHLARLNAGMQQQVADDAGKLDVLTPGGNLNLRTAGRYRGSRLQFVSFGARLRFPHEKRGMAVSRIIIE
jgi:hypothetical protein